MFPGRRPTRQATLRMPMTARPQLELKSHYIYDAGYIPQWLRPHHELHTLT